MRGVAGVEVVRRRLYVPLGDVPAQSYRQVNEFGRGRRRSTNASQFGCLVKRTQCECVTTRRRQRQMSRLEFGFINDVGQSPMHCPAPTRGGVRVDAMRQQGVGEAKTVAGNLDDALVLGLREDRQKLFGVGVDGPRHQLQCGVGQTRCRKQRLLSVGGQPTDPGPHQFGERSRQRCPDTSGVVAHGARQFHGIEGIAARNIVDPPHRRS